MDKNGIFDINHVVGTTINLSRHNLRTFRHLDTLWDVTGWVTLLRRVHVMGHRYLEKRC